MSNHQSTAGRRTRPCRTEATVVAALAALCLVLPLASQAEEGGSGHYIPGSMASFMDVVPPTETFLARLNVMHYDGSASKALPIAGLDAANASVKSTAYGLTLLWRPPVEMTEGWSYAMSTTIPYVTMEVTADVQGGGGSVRRSSKVSGLGDIILMPLMLNYVVNPDLSSNFRVAFYAPTGAYEVGRLANTGKNFWTLEPTLAFAYLGKQNGIEASLFTGISFNKENPDTQYKSGSQLHLDGTLAQHFPFAGGLAGVGLSGYYYKQVSADSGTGATLGDFKAKSVGIGPALSYAGKAGQNDYLAELKWLHESSTENRLKGDFVWFKFIYKFF